MVARMEQLASWWWIAPPLTLALLVAFWTWTICRCGARPVPRPNVKRAASPGCWDGPTITDVGFQPSAGWCVPLGTGPSVPGLTAADLVRPRPWRLEVAEALETHHAETL